MSFSVVRGGDSSSGNARGAQNAEGREGGGGERRVKEANIDAHTDNDGGKHEKNGFPSFSPLSLLKPSYAVSQRMRVPLSDLKRLIAFVPQDNVLPGKA